MDSKLEIPLQVEVHIHHQDFCRYSRTFVLLLALANGLFFYDCYLCFYIFLEGYNSIFFRVAGRCLISELLELLPGASGFPDFEHIESYSLVQGLALSHHDNVPNLDIPEAGQQVHRHVLMVFLKVVVLLNVVEVVLVDNNGPPNCHLGHHTKQNSPLDGDITSKGALLVNIHALNDLLEHLEA